jgi:hypothetical protein
VDVNAESSPLQPSNRDGGIDQDWAGDDQGLVGLVRHACGER